MADGGLERVHEVECRLRAGFLAVVVNRGLNVGGGEGAKVNLHRLVQASAWARCRSDAK